MMKLYNIPVSGNCHKIRLILSFLNLPYETYELDLSNQEQKGNHYLTMNPFGQAPVLEDNSNVIRDSHAILIYLASVYGNKYWWPDKAIELAQITAWLSTSANEITQGPAAIRAHYKFGRKIDMEMALQTSKDVISIIEQHLDTKDWMVGDKPSIADIAIYPYLALAHEGKIDLKPNPNILAWFKRFEALNGFVTMPGIFLQ